MAHTRKKVFDGLYAQLEETVNSHAFHACIHGFESRTDYIFGGLPKSG